MGMNELKGKKVLVTGGAGFIGSHLSETLLRLGARVVIYDNFDLFYQGKENNIASIINEKNASVVRGDILDLQSLISVAKGADMIYHLAAQPGVRYCNSEPVKAHQVNASGTMNVMLAAKQAGVRKVIYASSSSVYGNPKRLPLSEDSPVNPANIYGATKLAGEKYCMTLGDIFGIQTVCLRFFSVYGPRGRPDQVLYSFAMKVMKNESPVIYGNGSQTRDFTFVSDVVDATVLASLFDEANGHIMNIGYGRETSILTAAKKIVAYFDSKIGITFKKGYVGDFERTLADNRLARSLLSWKPQFDFDSGLNEFLIWISSAKSRKESVYH